MRNSTGTAFTTPEPMAISSVKTLMHWAWEYFQPNEAALKGFRYGQEDCYLSSKAHFEGELFPRPSLQRATSSLRALRSSKMYLLIRTCLFDLDPVLTPKNYLIRISHIVSHCHIPCDISNYPAMPQRPQVTETAVQLSPVDGSVSPVMPSTMSRAMSQMRSAWLVRFSGAPSHHHVRVADRLHLAVIPRIHQRKNSKD